MNRLLVDLAHSTGAAVDQALAISKAPVVWSHGWVDTEEGRWTDRYGLLRRRLSLAHARKIAERGGVIGLWGLGSTRQTLGWPVAPGDTRAYARELAKLVDKIGADHVALGTDIEGVGPNWTVNDYGHVRNVIERSKRSPSSTRISSSTRATEEHPASRGSTALPRRSSKGRTRGARCGQMSCGYHKRSVLR